MFPMNRLWVLLFNNIRSVRLLTIPKISGADILIPLDFIRIIILCSNGILVYCRHQSCSG
jgi:hypothetical protein